jgi:uncharacterized protein YggT (Ycf19 family)
MLHLSLVTITLEFFKIYIYQNILRDLPLFEKFQNFLIETFGFLMQTYGNGFYLNLFGKEIYFNLTTIVQGSIDSFIKSTPPVFIFNIRTALVCFRNICSIRYTISWFPNINPYRGFWQLITEPVDMIVRPLCWYLPKYAYFDLTTWVVYFILDGLINYCDFILRILKLYQGQI